MKKNVHAKKRSKVKTFLTVFLTVIAILLLFLIGGGVYLYATSHEAVKEMTEVVNTVDAVVVYVPKDDPAEELKDIKDYQVGILSELDRTNTYDALEEMEETEDFVPKLQEAKGVVELTDTYVEGKTDAILINTAYLSLLEGKQDEFLKNNKIIWQHKIERKLELEEAVTAGDITTTPFLVYLSGNDTYDKNANGRSDVNILMAVNPENREILLVNTPRDYYVDLAEHNGKDKLTHAGIYGVDISMKTLGDLYEVPVTYYARINFTGFIDIVDAIGGITVMSTVEFDAGGNHYVEGENDLNGKEALAFVRERYSFKEGDRQRGKNQQAAISAMIKKMCSPQILLQYKDLMKAAQNVVETNMSLDDITKLIEMQIKKGGSWKVDSISVDGSGSSGPCYSAPYENLYRMIPDEDSVKAAQEKLKTILNIPLEEEPEGENGGTTK